MEENTMDYISLNAMLNLWGSDGKLQLDKDKEAARRYFLDHVNQNTVFFYTLKEKLDYLVNNDYYDKAILDMYDFSEIKSVFQYVYSFKYRFLSFVSALKFYSQYALKNFAGDRYLERYEDRVVMVALTFGEGGVSSAMDIADEIINNRYQPATPTFLNAGKAQRGEYSSCFPAGTKITMKNGKRKNIEDVKVDDEVLTGDGSIQKVTHTIVSPNNKINMVEITPRNSEPVLTTANHPILIYSTILEDRPTVPNLDTISDNFYWVQAKDVRPYFDYVISVYQDNSLDFFDSIDLKDYGYDFNHSKEGLGFHEIIELDRNFGNFISEYIFRGYINFADNYNTDMAGIIFDLNTENSELIKMVDLVKKVFGIEPIVELDTDKQVGIVFIPSQSVANMLTNCVGNAENQKSLGFFFGAPKEFILGLIHRYLHGGHKMTTDIDDIDYLTESICFQIRSLALSVGIANQQMKFITSQGFFEVTNLFSIDESDWFYTKGAISSNATVCAKPVVTKEIFQAESTVYNLEIENNHTYIANNIVVHNCYLLSLSDNMESIARGITDSLQLSKRGGGVALNLTDIREFGAPIKKIEGQASGIVPVMKILEDSFKYANQLGARQGAGAVYLHAHHPDIMRFLDTKRENADEAVRIKTLSIGVTIPDITFELAKSNKDMYLFSPYDVKKVYGIPLSEIDVSEEYHNMVENPEIHKTKINARQLFTTIAELNFESGYPYILFTDTANRANPIEGKIKMSNLCVTGDTKILTDKGYREVKSLYESQEDFSLQCDQRAINMDLNAYGTKVVPSTKMFKTASEADIMLLKTIDGYNIRATPWHKMYVKRKEELLKISLAHVEIGDKLLIQKFGSNSWGNQKEQNAYILGSETANKAMFTDQDNQNDDRIMIVRSEGDYITKKYTKSSLIPEIIWNGDYQTISNYLTGLIQSGANFTHEGEFRDFVSFSETLITDMQILLLQFGISTTIYISGNNWVLVGKSSEDDKKLSKLSLLHNMLANKDNEKFIISESHGFSEVTHIEYDGVEDVYDVTVDDGNSVIFNGIITGNCSEILQSQTDSTFKENGFYQTLGDDISCNLGSMNIAKSMDGGDLAKTVDISMRLLTKVSEDLTIGSVPSIDQRNKSTHAVGLGQMNLHGFLGREKIMYGSPEALDFVSSYMAAINFYSLKTSCALAKEKGESFRGFKDSTYATGEYFDMYINNDFRPKFNKVSQTFSKFGIILPDVKDWEMLKNNVMHYGLYNQYRQAVAPTGSISYVNYSTSSMLPIPSKIEIRKEGKMGRVNYPAPYMNEENLEYYKDAYELGPQAIIDTYAAAAPHVDQGMSMTLFLDSHSTTRDINKAQISAWKSGCKSIYYVRLRQIALEGTEVECVSCSI